MSSFSPHSFFIGPTVINIQLPLARLPRRQDRSRPSALHPVMEIVPNKALSLSLLDFGLWRVYFSPCLVRPGRRLPVQGLSEGSLGFRDRLEATRTKVKKKKKSHRDCARPPPTLLHPLFFLCILRILGTRLVCLMSALSLPPKLKRSPRDLEIAGSSWDQISYTRFLFDFW